MNVLITLAHPERQSFNGGLADIAKERLEAAGHSVELNDLYRKGFDPVEGAHQYPRRETTDIFYPLDEQKSHFEQGQLPDDVQREIALLDWADLLILQFPLWWHSQPAILKGWFDRVLVFGGLYSGSKRYNNGHFAGKKAICSVTTGSPEKAFMPFGRAGNMVEWLWPIHSSLYYVGFDVLPPQVSYGVQGGGIQYQAEHQLEQHLRDLRESWSDRVTNLKVEPAIPFTGWDDWDHDGVLRDNHPMRWRP
ncbi:NAD(P)H-dependent oxidoreductase [Marinobacter sp. CHS3-4]|uniref:NAD(P)H-dependent oxidoreductase n=1 Tax=Marinobacter sp. CHS3-4 TaxID=3045174 RepID=UPI0024B4D800|nr:NAD(P)H-dependent oxidoreductase [Marinobacter sp. CHS3-4]MDI9246431.1 NAD(P)H-dependent oxidoreductase [Marinobacter sp. CHS3-4]